MLRLELRLGKRYHPSGKGLGFGRRVNVGIRFGLRLDLALRLRFRFILGLRLELS